jgi:hypothetical protein
MTRVWAGVVAAAIAAALVPVPASAQAASAAPAPISLMPDKAALAQAVESQSPPSDFWSARTVLIAAGVGAAAVASYMTWHENRDLSQRKAAILALPPTAIDQWNSDFTAAQNVQRSRDFWRSVAIGVGGVTAGYWATTAFEEVAPRVGGPFSVKLPKKGWAMHFDPFGRQVALSGSF